MNVRSLLYLLFCYFFLQQNLVSAQRLNYQKNITASLDSSNFQQLIKWVKGKPNPLIDSTYYAISKYMQSISIFEGKTINSIQIEQKHFGADVNSPDPSPKNKLIDVVNRMHNKTNESVISKNLFFKVNDPLNTMIIAYNEKWLRDLDYIQDARILALYAKGDNGNVDSSKVDLIIVTKDIFPIGGLFNLKNTNAFEAKLNTENLNDKGNAYSIYQNYDSRRREKMGWGFDYTKRNILGSFFDIKTGIQTYSNNYVNGANSASEFFIMGTRPLLHPLSRWTYGFDFHKSSNKNSYDNWSDSLFKSSYQYRLSHYDLWAGYQIISHNHLTQKNATRYFVQLRYLDNTFSERPTDYLSQIDKNYQTTKAFFTSFTFFKQEIIRAQYLYGFGRNEDLPKGKSFMITAGNYKREGLTSPYVGVQYESYQMSNAETITHIKLNAGSSYLENQLQDFRFLSSIERISKLYYLPSGYKYRHILNMSFAQTLKNKFNEALLINSIYGIPQLNKERIKGGTRIAANWESIWYNQRPFFGFKKAPFVFGNLTYIRTIGDPISLGDIYSSVGGGIRIRNENLIFGTIELKGYYFPRTALQLSPWNISLITNIRFKYNSSIINKPDFVAIN